MAKHRRRHRRYGDALVSMPSLGDIKEYNPFGKSLNSTDVIVGAGIGLVGGAAVKYLLNKAVAPASQPAFLQKYLQPITSIAAGIVAYMLERKKNRGRAAGHLIGAAVAGVVPTAWNLFATAFPAFADPYLSLPGYAGLIQQSPFGFIQASPQPGALNAYEPMDDPAAAMVNEG